MQYLLFGHKIGIDERVARATPPRIRRFLKQYERDPTVSWDREIDLSLLPPFVSRVLSLLREIPPGETRTYGDLAREVGSKNLARAVGRACALNPVPILVPCHRVVASRGIGGYSQGLELKKRLLEHEGASISRTRTPRKPL